MYILGKMVVIAATCVVACFAHAAAENVVPVSDSEVWNQGVRLYRAGEATNALSVLKPLMLSKTHGPRAAEVVAKLAYDMGDLELAADAAQIALRAAPKDEKANRNFTRATDRLPEQRAAKHVEEVLRAAQGKDPGAMLHAATYGARTLLMAAGGLATNTPAEQIALADALSAEAEKMSDTWYPVRESIVQNVTNQEQAATIVQQIEQAQAKTKKAARELADLDSASWATLSDVEHDFTRFLKLTAMPPAALGEDLTAQSNAWLDVEAFNGRAWQQDALDYTRVFRAKFPMWARAYEQQAQADTNKPPFSAEDQAKVAALATQLEKIQLECAEKLLPPKQQEALEIIAQIQALLPKDPNGGGKDQQRDNQQPNDDRQQKNRQDNQQQGQNQDPQQQQNQDEAKGEDQSQDEQPLEQESAGEEKEDESPEEKEVEAVLKKAQERNDEHEAEKRARMRKAPLPPNERDW